MYSYFIYLFFNLMSNLMRLKSIIKMVAHESSAYISLASILKYISSKSVNEIVYLNFDIIFR